MSLTADSLAQPPAERTDVAGRSMSDFGVSLVQGADWKTLPTEAWLALGRRAMTENPFLHQQFVEAHLTAGLGAGEAKAIAINKGGVLAGLFPFRSLKVGPLPLRWTGTSTLNLYQFNGAPLVAADEASSALDTWLNQLGRPGCPTTWVFSHIDLQSHFAEKLLVQARDKGYALQIHEGYHRPRLTREHETFEAHVKAVLSKRRVKDIRRNLRRLAERGDVRLEHASAPDTVNKRVEDFLRMEKAGWKGEAGTAFLCDPRTDAFARSAFAGKDEGIISVDSLLVGQTPVAISINIQDGDTRFTPKCAIDEDYKTYSPGVLLEYKVMEAFFASQSPQQMDSAVTTDAHLVAGLWNASVPHGTIIVGPSGLQCALVAGTLGLREKAKAWVARFRR